MRARSSVPGEVRIFLGIFPDISTGEVAPVVVGRSVARAEDLGTAVGEPGQG